ncbi:MAG TPA: hypothetical protein VFA45_14025 [Actinomycetes bacterium]|nr:hypothetical protein [Actinomycetes bacterium]
MGLLLCNLDQPVASSYFDAAAVAAEETDDPELGAWVAERRVSRAGTTSGGLPAWSVL